MISLLFLYILTYSLLIIFLNRFIEKKIKLNELKREILTYFKSSKEKIYYDINFLEKYRSLLEKAMKISLINIFLIILFFITIQPYFSLKYNENILEIKINNPLYVNSKIYLNINEKGEIFFVPENRKIFFEINESVRKINIQAILYELPFNIPILNRKWISPVETFIILFLFINFLIRFIEIKFK